jgi:WD40 repeat protein
MQRIGSYVLALLAIPALAARARGDEGKGEAVSFMKDVAPILVKNCIACHNARKAESKYNMTTFSLLAKGGQQGEGTTLEPGDPEASQLVELIRPNGQPRMPYKQDPLPPEAVATIERWVKEGAKYDGEDKSEDWVSLLHKRTPVNVPEKYPVPVPITALAFSPDGSGLAAAGYHEVNLWKAAEGALSRRLKGLPERVYDIAYSPDGKWLATAGGDPGLFGSVKLWVAEPDGGGKPVRDLLESNDSVFAVAFSPDSTLLAAAGADRAVRVWEVASGKLVATIEDHADWVLDVAFSPDGKRLATASRDKTAKVFDVEKKESLVTFPGHGEAVYCVGFGPDGKTIATGGGDNQVRLWRPDEDAKQVRSLGGFGGPVFRLVFANEGKALVATGADRVVRVFNPNDGSTIRNLDGQEDWTYALAVSADGKAVAAGDWDGKVRIWALADGKPSAVFLAAPGLQAPAK